MGVSASVLGVLVPVMTAEFRRSVEMESLVCSEEGVVLPSSKVALWGMTLPAAVVTAAEESNNERRWVWCIGVCGNVEAYNR